MTPGKYWRCGALLRFRAAGGSRVRRAIVGLLGLIGMLASGCNGSAPAESRAAEEGRGEKRVAESPRTEAGQAATPAAAKEGDWSQFRGPTGMGATTARLPVNWSTGENIAWKVPLPGPGASSPVVFGDHIYLTYYTGYFVPGESGGSLEELKRHVMALARTSGETVWDKAFPAKLPEEASIRDHGYAASTAAADALGVVVFFGKSGVIALDHTGKEQWRSDVGSATNGWGSAASPVLYQDLVFINASVESGALYALDRRSGEKRWQQKGIKESWNTPVLVTAASGREELVVAVQGSVLAFDPQKGTPLWSCKTDIGWYMVPSVVADQGVVYCLGGRSGIAALAVRAGGSGDVTGTHRLWTTTKGSNVTSPVYRDGHLYFASDSRGTALCLKADTGAVVYEQRLERAGQVYGSSLLADGKVYYLTREGKTFVLAAQPEFKQLAVNDLNDRSIFNASPQVLGNQLLIRSDKYLSCIGK